MSWLLWSLVGLPALAGTGLLLTGRRAGRAAAPVGVGAAAVVAVLAVVAAATRPSARAPFVAGGDLALSVDPLAAVVLPTVTVVALLVLVLSWTGVREHRVRFFGLMLLFEAAVVLTVTASTLVSLLLAWEVMGATSYALIGLSWSERAKVDGARTAFLVTRTADLGLYLAAGAALAGAGTLELSALPGATGGWRDLAAAGIVVAGLGKAAQLPFSSWLSRAMEGPSPVSALLHSAAMVAMGGFLLLRVEPLLAATGWAGPVVAWAGALTTVVLGLVAVAQTDLKQLLAASTAAQLGFVVLAAGSGAVAAGTVHLVAHAAVKSLLFLVAGVWLTAYGTRDLRRLGGASRAGPVVGGCFVVGTLVLAGLPPLSLWVTKDEVLAGAFARSPALGAVGLLGAALSAVYAGRALFLVLGPGQLAPLVRPAVERIPLIVLAAAAAVLGVVGTPVLADPLREALGDAPAAGPLGLAVSAVLAVGGLALARRRPLTPLPLPASAVRWFDLEAVTTVGLVRPVQALSRACDRFDGRLSGTVAGVAHGAARTAGVLARADDRVLAASVDRTAAGTARLARGSARIDVDGIDGAVRSLAAGSRSLGQLARRPQTGQVHTYYAQAAAVLAAALLLLLLVR